VLRRKPDLEPRHVELAELVEMGGSLHVGITSCVDIGGLTISAAIRTHRCHGSD
jgi:hypothetical protein